MSEEIDDLLERLEHPAPPEIRRQLAERIADLDDEREFLEKETENGPRHDRV